VFATRCNEDIATVREEMEVMRLHERSMVQELQTLRLGHVAAQEQHDSTSERDTSMASVGSDELAAKVTRTLRQLKVANEERKMLRKDLAAMTEDSPALQKVALELEQASEQARADQTELSDQVETLINELRDARVAKVQIQNQADADKAMMEKLLKEFKTRLVTAETMFEQWQGGDTK
jgi:hypothetical protein